VRDRKRLAFAGMISIAIAMNERGELADDPDVELRGIPETNRAGESMAEIAYDAALDTFQQLPRARRRDPDAVAEAITRAVRAAIGDQWGKKPGCYVHVLTV
jgi:ribonuclease J